MSNDLKPGDRICIDGYIGTYKVVGYPAAWNGTSPPLCAEKESSLTGETIFVGPWDTWHYVQGDPR